MPQIVNLDALIPREDFLSPDQSGSGGESGKSDAGVTDLTKGESFFSTLRKPDFQRETAAWSPAMVKEFVKSFIEDELIPSVICWQSPTRLSFVIDGAHRLSAIIAWILDDYGDGDLSQKQYGYNVPDDQIKIARKTRDLIDDEIGSYKSFKAETAVPGSAPRVAPHVRALAHSKIPLLWVKGNDPARAERAFFTINQSAVEIDPTELKILNARTKPNAIAARAIVRNATGHRYWATFSPAGQQEIEAHSKEIYSALYHPPLRDGARTEELPIAGHGYGTQTLPLIFDLVNIANDLPVTDASKLKGKLAVTNQSPPDEAQTLSVMKGTLKTCRLITGTHASSLGLHPAVHFYANSGRHQPTTVLATALLVSDLEKRKAFNEFSDRRGRFEDFLVSHKMYINQLTSRFGSMVKGYMQMKEYYDFILSCIGDGASDEEIETKLRESPKFQFLVKEKPTPSTKAKPFSGKAKQAHLMKSVLASAFKCALCHGYVDKKSMHDDHEIDVKDGGLADIDNGRWLHPYCDSTYKYYLRSPHAKAG